MNTRDALAELVDPAEKLSLLGSGYAFTEGPAWSAAEGCLYFSDIPGDARWRWSDRGGMELVKRPNFKGNGMAFDLDGNLLVCESVTSCVARFRRSGERELVAFHYRGKYLQSPNDICTRRADGSIYFSDPDFGRWNDVVGAKRSRDLDFNGVYRAPAEGGELQLLVDEDEFVMPNGLCFSPDETLLYVDDSHRGHIKVFDVAGDGSLANGRVFFEGIGPGIEPGPEETLLERHSRLHNSGAVDGMRCDERGNVWVTGPGGIWVISPEGERVGVIETPEVAGNLCWGGGDLRSLFLMTSTTVHVLRTRVGPPPLP